MGPLHVRNRVDWRRMREPRIHLFYRPEMVIRAEIGKFGAQSPEKPRLLLDHLARPGLLDSFPLRGDFAPLDRQDFLLAHTPVYVDAFFAGEPPLCSGNRLPWSPELVES